MPDPGSGRRRVLLLAGTTEARRLAERYADRDDVEVVVSLAGRTAKPVPLPGTVRVGGFGGPDGLARYLRAEGIGAVVDATHPFAARMPHNAAAACTAAGVPRVRLLRPEWVPEDGNRDRWVPVPDLEAAARSLEEIDARRVFLTTGRSNLAPFKALDARAVPDPLRRRSGSAAPRAGRGDPRPGAVHRGRGAGADGTVANRRRRDQEQRRAGVGEAGHRPGARPAGGGGRPSAGTGRANRHRGR